jgi:hypothetical protein
MGIFQAIIHSFISRAKQKPEKNRRKKEEKTEEQKREKQI